MKRILLVPWLAMGCGDDGGGGSADATTGGDSSGTTDVTGDTPSGPFTLTSAMLVDGQPFAVANTCDDPAGVNRSPAFAWTGAPAGTMSFAIVFVDRSFGGASGFLHSVIYDIPASRTDLPENVEKTYAPANVPGAHQTLAFNGSTRGYLGPCPNPADGPHMYEFALFAINAPTLPGAMMSTTGAQARMIINANNLGSALLTGTRDR
jgi:Raf kinase inhibitor-like YbhB/YbcL family protein